MEFTGARWCYPVPLFHPCAGPDPPGGELGWSRGGSEAPGATKPAATSMRTGTSTTREYQRHHAQRYADGIARPVSKPPPPPLPTTPSTGQVALAVPLAEAPWAADEEEPHPYEMGFGNWGVASFYGAVRDTDQFAGWYLEGNKLQWQSCTRKLPKPDCRAYNYNNCTGQTTVPDNKRRYGGYSYYLPYGVPCDTIGVQTVEQIDMHLYELDWPDADEGVAFAPVWRCRRPTFVHEQVVMQWTVGLDRRNERRRHRIRACAGGSQHHVLGESLIFLVEPDCLMLGVRRVK